MIDFIPSTTIFRKVPYQSGNYEIDLTIELTNHNSIIDFALSGGGSTFFRFGAVSGNYYASGASKQFFESNVPDTERKYLFVIGDSGYDVYDFNRVPFILGSQKVTGRLENIVLSTTTGANGQFSLDIYGKKPIYTVTGGLVFPVNGTNNSSFYVVNSGVNAFHILSGTLSNVANISGLSGLPITVEGGESKKFIVSGKLANFFDTFTSVTLNSDFNNFFTSLGIKATYFSGSGYTVTAGSGSRIAFQSSENIIYSVLNSGTQDLSFTPYISQVVRTIPITAPTYSGNIINNYFSGFFDTAGKFYINDKITWSGGEFVIIQQQQSGISLLSITGESASTGLCIGSNTNIMMGQSFSFPFNYQMSGLRAKLCALDSTFTSSDFISGRLYSGNGVSGTFLALTSPVICSTLPISIVSGTYSNFLFASGIQLNSGVTYSFIISGSTGWCTPDVVTSKKALWLQNTGAIYGQGSGFTHSGVNTKFSGDAILDIPWIPQTGARRYLVNHISGNSRTFGTVVTGNYDKYLAEQCFIIASNQITTTPNSTSTFLILHTGMASGVNVANLQLSGIGYSGYISGEAF